MVRPFPPLLQGPRVLLSECGDGKEDRGTVTNGFSVALERPNTHVSFPSLPPSRVSERAEDAGVRGAGCRPVQQVQRGRRCGSTSLPGHGGPWLRLGARALGFRAWPLSESPARTPALLHRGGAGRGPWLRTEALSPVTHLAQP